MQACCLLRAACSAVVLKAYYAPSTPLNESAGSLRAALVHLPLQAGRWEQKIVEEPC